MTAKDVASGERGAESGTVVEGGGGDTPRLVLRELLNEVGVCGCERSDCLWRRALVLRERGVI